MFNQQSNEPFSKDEDKDDETQNDIGTKNDASNSKNAKQSSSVSN